MLEANPLEKFFWEMLTVNRAEPETRWLSSKANKFTTIWLFNIAMENPLYMEV